MTLMQMVTAVFASPAPKDHDVIMTEDGCFRGVVYTGTRRECERYLATHDSTSSRQLALSQRSLVDEPMSCDAL